MNQETLPERKTFYRQHLACFVSRHKFFYDKASLA